jgi:hypothetical protein
VELPDLAVPTSILSEPGPTAIAASGFRCQKEASLLSQNLDAVVPDVPDAPLLPRQPRALSIEPDALCSWARSSNPGPALSVDRSRDTDLRISLGEKTGVPGTARSLRSGGRRRSPVCPSLATIYPNYSKYSV